MRKIITIAIVLAATGCASPALSETGLSEMETRITEVRAFKNGSAFVVREGQPSVERGWVRVDSLPRTAHGTMFVLKGDERVDRMVSYLNDETENGEVAAHALAGHFKLSPGKSVTVVESGGRETSGKVVLVDKVLVVKSDKGLVAIDPRKIESVSMKSGELPVDSAGSSGSQAVMKMLLKDGSNGPIGFTYLAQGFSWAPSYRLDITDKKTARIILSGTIINDLEDLDRVSVKLISGFPNLRFKDTQSPFNPTVSLQSFLSAITNGRYSSWTDAAGILGQMVFRNAATNFSTPSSSRSQNTAPRFTATHSDLFFYPVEDVTLKKGERMLVTVFDEEVPYEHVYLWDIDDHYSNYRFYQNGQSGAGDRNREKVSGVWHAVRLLNETQMPWTTGPATTTEKGDALGQDTLRYTAAGQDRDVYITRAFDVTGEESEEEVRREYDAEKVNRSTYSRVWVKGEVRLSNHKKKKARTIITKEVTGAVSTVSDKGISTRVGEHIKSINPVNNLEWDIVLEPGQEKTLTYEYSLLIN
jgi:hypothetical protein